MGRLGVPLDDLKKFTDSLICKALVSRESIFVDYTLLGPINFNTLGLSCGRSNHAVPGHGKYGRFQDDAAGGPVRVNSLALFGASLRLGLWTKVTMRFRDTVYVAAKQLGTWELKQAKLMTTVKKLPVFFFFFVCVCVKARASKFANRGN